MRKRIFLAALFHETHTFLPGLTALEECTFRRGKSLLECRGDGSPLAGFLDVAAACDWEVVPLAELRAIPGPKVSDLAFETFWNVFRTEYTAARPGGLDAFFLVLHGAMVTESLEDAEGELLERIHTLEGFNQVPICGVLDLHANVTPRMARLTQGLIAYRENPHRDAYQTAIRAARLLDDILNHDWHPVTLFQRPAILWPPTGTGADDAPMRTLEQFARTFEEAIDTVLAVNVLAGFSFADTPYTGVSLTAITLENSIVVNNKLQYMAQLAWQERHLGLRNDLPLDDAIRNLQMHSQGPILIVEPADNIGGGAPGDCTSVLRAFIEHNIAPSVCVINDPETVRILSHYSIGDTCTLRIGGKGWAFDPGPCPLEVQLLSRTDGRFELEDAQSHLASMFGKTIDMGPCAVVRHGGVHILLTSRKTPPFDLGQLRSQGIQPETMFAINIKAAVAHRQAYDPIAKVGYTVDTPGPCSGNLTRFPYRNVLRPIYPLDR